MPQLTREQAAVIDKITDALLRLNRTAADAEALNVEVRFQIKAGKVTAALEGRPTLKPLRFG